MGTAGKRAREERVARNNGNIDGARKWVSDKFNQHTGSHGLEDEASLILLQLTQTSGSNSICDRTHSVSRGSPAMPAVQLKYVK